MINSTLDKKERRMRRTRRRLGITAPRQTPIVSSWEKLERDLRVTSHQPLRKTLGHKSLRNICTEHNIDILDSVVVKHEQYAYKVAFCRTRADDVFPNLPPVSRRAYFLFASCVTLFLITTMWLMWPLWAHVPGLTIGIGISVWVAVIVGTCTWFQMMAASVKEQHEQREAEFQRLLRHATWNTLPYNTYIALTGKVPEKIQKDVKILCKETDGNVSFSIEYFDRDPYIYAEFRKEKVYIGHWD